MRAVLLCLTLSGVTVARAYASTPEQIVLHHPSLDAEHALALGRALSGRATMNEPVVETLRERARRFPPRVEPGAVDRCATVATEMDLEAAITASEVAIGYLEGPRAVEEHARALSILPCLPAPVDPARAAALHLRQASLALEVQAPDRARAALIGALRFDPDATWEGAETPEGALLFTEARRAPFLAPPALLDVQPRPVALWVDGAAITDDGPIELPAGEHLVEYPDESGLTVRLESGPAVLRLPDVLSDDTLLEARPDGDRPLLAERLTWLFEPGEELLVVLPGAAWAHTVGTDTWEDRLAPLVQDARRTRSRVRTGTAVAVGGGVVALGGGIATGATWRMAAASKRAAEQAHDNDAFDNAHAQWERRSAALSASRAVLVAGFAALGTGVTLTRVGRWRLHPAVFDGGAGVTLAVDAVHVNP